MEWALLGLSVPVLACTFGGVSSGVVDGDESTGMGPTASTGSSVPDDGTTAGSSLSTDGGPGGDETATGEGTTAQGEASTDGGDTTGGSATALLEFDGPEDFGTLDPGESTSAIMTVSNNGTATATMMDADDPHVLFSFTGGQYPGTGGNCELELEPDASCSVEIEFTADMLGEITVDLALKYNDGSSGVGATTPMHAEVVGTLDDLIQNPSFEADTDAANNPPFWVEDSGDWRRSGSFSPPDGSYSMYAGSSAMEGASTHVAYQDIDVSSWRTSIDEGDIELTFEGSVYPVDNDIGHFALGFLDAVGDGPELAPELASSVGDWIDYSPDTIPVPAGTETIRVQLRCQKPGGNWCDVRFDDLRLSASYDPE